MYIYGKNVIKSVLSIGDKTKEIERVYLYEKFDDKNIISSLQQANILVNYLSKVEMDHLVNGNHQGVIAKIREFHYTELEELIVKANFLVILDHIEDPHNFGAIIRTCEAAGIDGIIIPKDRACEVNGTVIKVSTGSIDNMKITKVTNLNQTIRKLKQNDFWIIGTDMEGTDYTKIDYRGKIAIVIGNEGKGMSRLTSELCDFKASIPMVGKTNSLNASVASGIIVFEALKQRNINVSGL